CSPCTCARFSDGERISIVDLGRDSVGALKASSKDSRTQYATRHASPTALRCTDGRRSWHAELRIVPIVSPDPWRCDKGRPNQEDAMAVKPIPEGYTTFTPYFIVEGGSDF